MKVGVNGYGTIGKRLADAILLQDDMQLIGVSKVHPDYTVKQAVERDIPVYSVKQENDSLFKEHDVEIVGHVEDLIDQSDVVLDSSPSKMGEKNKPRYDGKKSIFQGGESSGLTPLTFVAQCNYDKAVGLDCVRVASCNTTALSRTLGKLNKSLGVEKAFVTVVRRAVDPHETSKGLMDSIQPATEIPSHHGPDVMEVLPGVEVISMAVKVPTKIMHLHALEVDLRNEYEAEEVAYELNRCQRTLMVDSEDEIESTAQIIEMSRDMMRPRNDIWETVIWRDSIHTKGTTAYLFQAVHQEAIVVPENIDAVRALVGEERSDISMRKTDTSLGII
jgi:glyceraldehyde-3-phosphate dehydrogenase (NAD(P))